MAQKQEILDAADALGKQIAEHEAAEKFEQATKALDDDVEAQRAVNDFQRHLQTLAEKQRNHQPIEPAEKQKLEELQMAVAMNIKVRALQQAQMDFLDLLREVMTRIEQNAVGEEQAAAATGAAPAPGGAGGAGGAGPILGPGGIGPTAPGGSA